MKRAGLSLIIFLSMLAETHGRNDDTVTIECGVGGIDVSTGNVDIRCGYSLEDFARELDKREEKLKRDHRDLIAIERELTDEEKEKRIRLEIELESVQASQADLKEAYAEKVKLLEEASRSLNELKGRIPGEQLKIAQEKLRDGDTDAAEKIFRSIADDGTATVALAAYEAGRLAENDIRYEEADRYFKKAVVLDEDNSTYLNAAGLMANKLGDYLRAEPLLKDALEIRQRVLGEEHPDTAGSYNNVASNLDDQGRYAEAEPLYRKGLEIRQRVLGEEHPSTAGSYNNLAYNLNAQGRYAEAEPLYRKGLEIRQRVLGEEHPSTAGSYNNVAYNLNAQGRYAEAEPLYRKGLEIMRIVFPNGHPNTEVFEKNLELLKKQLSQNQ